MSRLDSFLRRLQAQRGCLNDAAALVGARPGPVFELGLGNPPLLQQVFSNLGSQFP